MTAVKLKLVFCILEPKSEEKKRWKVMDEKTCIEDKKSDRVRLFFKVQQYKVQVMMIGHRTTKNKVVKSLFHLHKYRIMTLYNWLLL